MAIQEINAAGGVLGNPGEVYHGDSCDTSTNVTVTTRDEQLQRGVDAVIRAASSSVSLTVFGKITSAGVVQIARANTSTQFTDYDDNGLYFRTAASDTVQGAVLAELPEAYDATIVTALAAEAAGNDSGTAIAGKSAEVNSGGTVCTTYVECLDLLRSGEDVNSDGRSGPDRLRRERRPVHGQHGRLGLRRGQHLPR